MNVTELKNDKGVISGIVIPSADFRELKISVNPKAPFYAYISRVLSEQPKSEELILPNGHTIDETNKMTALTIEELYRHAFEKGVPMFYQDERTKGPKEFIRANPDGSEDLISYNLKKRNYTVIKKLLPPGKGYWAYLLRTSG